MAKHNTLTATLNALAFFILLSSLLLLTTTYAPALRCLVALNTLSFETIPLSFIEACDVAVSGQNNSIFFYPKYNLLNLHVMYKKSKTMIILTFYIRFFVV